MQQHKSTKWSSRHSYTRVVRGAEASYSTDTHTKIEQNTASRGAFSNFPQLNLAQVCLAFEVERRKSLACCPGRCPRPSAAARPHQGFLWSRVKLSFVVFSLPQGHDVRVLFHSALQVVVVDSQPAADLLGGVLPGRASVHRRLRKSDAWRRLKMRRKRSTGEIWWSFRSSTNLTHDIGTRTQKCRHAMQGRLKHAKQRSQKVARARKILFE